MSMHERQQEIIDEFNQLKSWEDRYKQIIKIGKGLEKLPEDLYQEKFLVKGCQSQVWLHAHKNEQGQMILQADSDAMIVKGLVALLLRAYSGLTPQEVLEAPPEFIQQLGFQESLSPSRANGLLSMIKQIMLYAQAFQLTQ
ncbi:MAG: SufE family protein [Pseudomonadota bacterium]